MPIGRNVLQLINIQESANYTCIAASTLGQIDSVSVVKVQCKYKLLENIKIRVIITQKETMTSLILAFLSLNLFKRSQITLSISGKESDNTFQNSLKQKRIDRIEFILHLIKMMVILINVFLCV